jgi:hypothetical protein
MIPLRDLGALLDRAIDVWAAATASPKKRKRS